MDRRNLLDLNLDSTPIITWLATARQAGDLDQPGLRRSLIARLIWQVSYQKSPGLIESVAYLLGWRTWGEEPRATLAADIEVLRPALALAGKRLAFSVKPGQRGFYFHGRPLLDPQLEQGTVGAVMEVDPAQLQIRSRMTPAERFSQVAAMIEFVQRMGLENK